MSQLSDDDRLAAETFAESLLFFHEQPPESQTVLLTLSHVAMRHENKAEREAAMATLNKLLYEPPTFGT